MNHTTDADGIHQTNAAMPEGFPCTVRSVPLGLHFAQANTLFTPLDLFPLGQRLGDRQFHRPGWSPQPAPALPHPPLTPQPHDQAGREGAARAGGGAGRPEPAQLNTTLLAMWCLCSTLRTRPRLRLAGEKSTSSLMRWRVAWPTGLCFTTSTITRTDCEGGAGLGINEGRLFGVERPLLVL